MKLPGLFKGKYTALTTTVIYTLAALVCIMIFRRVFYPALPEAIQSNTFADVLFIAITALFLFYILSGKDTKSKTLENAVVQSEHRWRLTFDEANDPIFILDKNLNIQQVNPKAVELYGYSALEFKKLNLINIRSERTRHLVDLKELAFKENKGLNYEIEHIKKDGTVLHVAVSSKAIVRNGNVEYLNIMHDLTDRKKIEERLVKSEKKYRELIETAPVGILVSIEGKFEYANPEFVRIIGADSEKDLIGTEVINFIHPRYHGAVAERRELVMRGESTPEMEQVWKKLDGTDVHLSVSAMPFITENSRGVQVLVRDISERKRSEAQKIENQARLNGIVNSAMDAIITIGADRKIIVFNSAAEKMFLCSAKEAVGSQINRFIPERFKHVHDSHIERFAATGDTSRSMGKLNPISGVRANGEEFPIEASISKIEVNSEMLFTVILRDITEKMKYETSLKDTNDKLHALAAHLQTVREDERKMLSREIHDQLGQELTALKIDISLLGKKVRKIGHDEVTNDILENLNGMSNLADHTINTVRRIARELRPDMLDKLGLKEALAGHCEDFEKRTGIKCIVTLPEEFGFGGNKDTTIFRIVQESLTNVARHSGADEVKITAENLETGLIVTIADNGKGIIEDEIKNTKSLGLLGIRERAFSEGGTLEIQNSNGTRLILTIPFKQS